MTVQLNHTIVQCRDKQQSATFLTEILGLPEPKEYGPFFVVEMDNGASLDFDETADEVSRQHYAFLIGEKDFDEIYGRILDRGLEHWADPFKRHPGRINRNDGGRGVYWEDPDGHLLEVITRPYGSGS
jgi:catechol 2,3-dioxygenase-like lactoylglutathione lyase family enzyme